MGNCRGANIFDHDCIQPVPLPHQNIAATPLHMKQNINVPALHNKATVQMAA